MLLVQSCKTEHFCPHCHLFVLPWRCIICARTLLLRLMLLLEKPLPLLLFRLSTGLPSLRALLFLSPLLCSWGEHVS